MFLTFLSRFCHGQPFSGADDVLALLQQEIALAFIGRFRWGLHFFSGKKSPFQQMEFFSALPDGASTEYQISNREFSDFLRTYFCDFLNNVYS